MSKSRNEIAQEFLKSLFGSIPTDSCIEVRVKRNEDPGARQLFLADPSALRVDEFPDDVHVWFGVSLRRLHTGSGKADDLTWATCVWADFDNVQNRTALVERLKAFAPTFIVDSGGGIHAYWRLNRTLDLRSDQERTYVREVVHGLAHVLGGDTTVHDPTRVMGLPGTYNVGNGKTKIYNPPRLVQILHHDPRAIYGVDELSRYRRPLVHRQGMPINVTEAAQAPASPPVIANLSIPDRLKKLVQDGWQSGCGYKSRSELDQAVMVAMTQGKHTHEDIFAVFKDPSNGISEKFLEKGTDGPRYLAATLASSEEWVRTHNTPGTSNLSYRIREHAGQIEVQRGNSWEVVFNHPIKAKARLTGAESGFLVEILTPYVVVERTLTAEHFANSFNFKRAINLAGAWTGTDKDLQLLTIYLEEQSPKPQEVVKTIGWHSSKVIFPNAQLVNGAFVPDTEYLYTGKLTEARLEDHPNWPALAQQIIDVLPLLHAPQSIIPIIGWFMATFVAPKLRKLEDNAFPLLMVFGTPEAGKTTILEFMLRLCGLNAPLNSAAGTRFTNVELLSSSNTLPIVFDEHRRSDIRQHKSNLYPILRETHKAQIHSRGRRDLSIVQYRLTAPVAIGGETPFRDSALVDRTIHVLLERGAKNEKALEQLRQLEVDRFNGGMYNHVQGKDIPTLWSEVARQLPPALRADRTNLRQLHGWQVVALGLRLLEPFLKPEQTAEMISQLSDFRKVSAEDITIPAKAVVIETVRVIRELIRMGRLRNGQEYAIKEWNGKTLLWFVPAVALPLVEEYFQGVDTDLPMTRETMLGRMKEESKSQDPIVVRYQEHFRLGKKSAKGIAIDLGRFEEETGTMDAWSGH